MRTFSTLLLLSTIAGCGDPPPAEGTEGATEEGATEQATEARTLTPEQIAADVESALNRDIDPCVDFYEFACGGWRDNTELPADRSGYTRSFSVIYDSNQEMLKGILEKAAAEPGDDPNMQKVGAVYGSCMDEAAADTAKAEPLQPLLTELEAIEDLRGFSLMVGKLGMVDVSLPLIVGVYGDFKDPSLNILHMSQSGLGLPDRDYYLELDDDGQKLLADYQAHVASMLQLAGVSEEQATADAAAIVAFETKLAEIHLPRHELRDPEANYHRLEREGARALFTNFDLDAFFEGMGYAELQQINVERPETYQATDKLIGETDLAVLKAYLRWHLIDVFSNHLSNDFVNANFAFYGKRLRGQAEIKPRWKRCVSYTQQHLGDVLAQLYVDRAFAGDSKDKSVEMITDIEAAFEDGLPELSWMDEKTQEGAKAKVATVKNKIGYPNKWREFGKLDVSGATWFDKVVATRDFTSRFWLDKVGNPVDQEEWFMSAVDVNAYYNPLANEMAFPAGILQPPFFDRSFPAAMNYGAIGTVMGHELTHGFDDSGRKFDPQGKMIEWWAPSAAEKFTTAATCVETAYDAFEVQPGVNVKGKLTLGENIADMGGIKGSSRAYTKWVEKHGAEPEIAGFPGDKLLYVAFAQSWCTLMTPEMERERIATDTHSPPRFRINGPLMHLPEFGETFGCEVGSPMRPEPEKVCAVW